MTILEAALTFFESIAIPLARDRGWKIAPCYPKKKEVHTKLVPQPLKQMSKSVAQIHAWAKQEPNANVCVYAKQIEGGLCFLDRDGELDIWQAYREETGKDFNTLEVQSSPGKSHFYFLQTPKTVALKKNITEKDTDGWFSFRVKNEYVCSIGSIHPKTGEPYKIVNDVPVIPMPDALVDWLHKQIKVKDKSPSGNRTKTTKIPRGQRYTALISEVGRMWARGYSRELVINNGLAWARERFDLEGGAFDEAMVRKEIEAIPNAYPPGEPNDSDYVPRLPITETSNAERLITNHANDIRYSSDRKTWCAWDGHIWRVNDVGGVMRRMQEVSLDIYNEARNERSDKLRKALAAWAMQSESRRTQENSMAVARWFPGVEVSTFAEVFDTHPILLNAQNCTINLETGESHQHRREDFLTKRIPINYTSDAKCPKFLKFLDEAMPGPGMLGYLSRFAGYCLTGLTVEQAWYMFFGATATGKSTLVKVLRGLLGPYSVSLPENYFLITKTGTDYATADLAGVRLATCSETNEGKFLDVAKIKALTGEEPIRAQKKYENFFEFSSQAKLILTTNHRPRLPDTDDSIWRRLKVLPFNAQCPEDKRVDDLAGKLLDEEGGGILAWAVLGAQAWFNTRLRVDEPAAIKASVNEYRMDEDVVQNFMNECCTLDPDARVARKELFREYLRWCEDNGYKYPYSSKKIASELHRLEIKGDGGKRFWIGIKLETTFGVTGGTTPATGGNR
jgi:putative DNA primase/helicase